MPRNSSGTYTLPTGNPVVTGTLITSTWANATMPDIGSELTNSLDRSGRGAMLAAFKATDGLVGTPGITFGNEPTTGWFRNGAGDLRVSVLASWMGGWNSTGLGVGVAALAKLHVKSTLEILRLETTTARGSGSNYIQFNDPTGQKGYLGYGSAGNDTLYINNSLNADAAFNTNSLERMRIDSAGNVNINGASPFAGNVKFNVKLATEASTSNQPVGIAVARAATDSILFLGYQTTPDAWMIGASFSSTGAFKGIAFATNDIERARFPFGGGFVIGATTLSAVGSGTDAFGVAGTIGIGTGGVTVQINASASGYFEVANRNTGGVKIYVASSIVALTADNTGKLTDQSGNELGWKSMPPSTPAGTSNAVIGQRGQIVIGALTSYTINTGIFARGDVITVYNDNTVAMTIIQGAGFTLRLGGTATTGTRTVAARGLATIIFNGGSEAIVGGSGVS